MTTKVCTNCFKSLGVESRMLIYEFLLNHPDSSVTDIVAMGGLTQPTVSYHLKEMKDNGVLISHKKGKNTLFSVNTFCPHMNCACILSGVQFPSKHNAS